MKFLRRSIYAIASLAMLSACSSDELAVDDPNGGGNTSDGEGVYMGLTIKMPSAMSGRSSTIEPGQSTDGNEVGKDYENTVSDVIIVLADPKTNAFITSGVVASNKLTAVPAENAYKSVAKVSLSNLAQFYNSTTPPTIGQNRQVNIFVYCNPTTEQRDIISKANFGNVEWINGTTSVDESASKIAQANKFVMTNAAIATRQLPNTVEDWNYYKTEAAAFDLSGINQAGQDVEVDNSASYPGRGPVKVDRMAARFDFKDGSPSTTPANTYDVVKDNNGKTLIQIELTKMGLVNLSKTMYDFRRVSDNGLPTGGNFKILGAETPTNYTVNPNAQIYFDAANNKFKYDAESQLYNFDFAAYFNNPFFTSSGRMDYSQWAHFSVIKDVLKGENDNYDQSNPYKIWHYAGANLIPGDTENQQNGLSTGVVFKGKMIPTEALKESDPELYDALKGTDLKGDGTDHILYSFNGSLYFSWDAVRKAAIEASVDMKDGVPDKNDEGKITVNRSNSLYLAVYGNGGMGTFTWGTTTYEDPDGLAVSDKSPEAHWTKWHDATGDAKNTALADMRKAMTGVGFTLYQSSTDGNDKGYYCYYFYWNRHNDNNNPGVMGPMEFAVVRNNVYKLAVTNIKQLGHPRTPENDPDKPTPDTPDESQDIYINVTCEVLPWVVRINNIEF